MWLVTPVNISQLPVGIDKRFRRGSDGILYMGGCNTIGYMNEANHEPASI